MTKGPIKILKGRVLLQINGNDVRTINDAEEILDGYVLATHGRLSLSDPHDPRFVPSMLTNLTLLSVKKPLMYHDWKDTFSFGAGDISMLRSGFTVSSITSHPNTLFPRSFHEAMNFEENGTRRSFII